MRWYEVVAFLVLFLCGPLVAMGVLTLGSSHWSGGQLAALGVGLLLCGWAADVMAHMDPE